MNSLWFSLFIPSLNLIQRNLACLKVLLVFWANCSFALIYVLRLDCAA
jgi:hypothetical protein